MVLNQKPTGRAASMPVGLLYGAGTSLAVTLVIAAILAKLVDMEKLPWENIGYGIMVLLFAASFAGAIVAHGKIKRQRLLVCAMSGAVYFAILMSITALFFGGQYEAVGVTAGVVIGGSVVAGLLGLRGGGDGKRKHGKVRHR